jgi:CheY-like chemotaxis protein
MSDAHSGGARPLGLPDDVLIVEDDPLIALDFTELLHGFGVQSVRTAPDVARALEMLAERLPKLALLDIGLRGEKSFAIADRLAEADIPFAFVTGYADRAMFPPRFAGAPILGKPYHRDELLALLGNWQW